MQIKTFRVSCGALRPVRQRSKVSKTFRTKFKKKFSEVGWNKSVKRLPKKKGGNKFADALLLRACARCVLGRSALHCRTGSGRARTRRAGERKKKWQLLRSWVSRRAEMRGEKKVAKIK